jgi:hypothetical protein
MLIFPVGLTLTVLLFSLWARFQLIEVKDLGFNCVSGGTGLQCTLRGLLVQAFDSFGIGYAAVFLGCLGTLTRSDPISLLAVNVGILGLMLYNWDYAALGFLLGVLVLARSIFGEQGH